MEWVLSKAEIKSLYRYLLIGILVLVMLSIACQVYRHTFGLDKTLKGLIPKLDVDEENNIPTWFSSALLLTCSLVLFLIFRLEREKRDRFSRHWAGLALIFLALSLDEVASIHEMTELPLRRLLDAKGYLTPTWIIPGIAVCLIILAYYWKFLASLEQPFKRLFLLSGAIFLAGALGLEMIGNNRAYHHGWDDFIYMWIHSAEELFEMIGAATFLYALLLYGLKRAVEIRTRPLNPDQSSPGNRLKK